MKNFFTLKHIIVYGIILAITVVVVLQTTTEYKVFPVTSQEPTVTQDGERQAPQLEPGQTCKGEPIYVDYKWPHSENGLDFNNPWECQIQCEDEKRYYIYYANGVGTQCDVLPECLDLGEDQGVTCNPPKSDQPDENEE
ncbi:MAG: hypothetical protein PHO92_00105 [Candidatus Peribacteraceae bacterium]|nr:hypothetical protein [Candidatus Peribacteraceae bacterium]